MKKVYEIHFVSVRNVEGTLVLKVVHNEATAHIGRLIAHQKSNKKASRGKPAKVSSLQ